MFQHLYTGSIISAIYDNKYKTEVWYSMAKTRKNFSLEKRGNIEIHTKTDDHKVVSGYQYLCLVCPLYWLHL